MILPRLYIKNLYNKNKYYKIIIIYYISKLNKVIK